MTLLGSIDNRIAELKNALIRISKASAGYNCEDCFDIKDIALKAIDYDDKNYDSLQSER